MMKVPSLGGTKNIIRKVIMRVIKDLDPAIEFEPIANALIKGHVVQGITSCADDDPDLFCVTREQRCTRNLVDAIVADPEDGRPSPMFAYVEGYYSRPGRSYRPVWSWSLP